MAEHFFSALEFFFKIALNFIHRNEFKLLRQRSYIQYTVQYCRFKSSICHLLWAGSFCDLSFD